MARADLTPYIAEGLGSGLGPRAALRSARAQGLRTNDTRWYREYNRAKLSLAATAGVIPRDWNKLYPITGKWETKRYRGYGYRVKVLLVDDKTGASKETWVTVISRRQRSEGWVIREALRRFKDPLKRYPSRVIVAFVMKGYRMEPK